MATFTVSFDMVDAYGRSTSKSFESIDLADFATALAAVPALATALANLSEAEILAYRLSQRVVYNDTVDAGANKDEGAVLSFRKEDNFKGAIRVPAPINAVFDADGSLDLTNGIVTAFASEFFAGGGNWTFSDGEQATALLSGYLET